MDRETEYQRLKEENQRVRDTIRQLNQIVGRLLEACQAGADPGRKERP